MAAGVPAILSTFQAEGVGMKRRRRTLIPSDLSPSTKGFLGSSTMMSTVHSLINPNYKESWETLFFLFGHIITLNKSGIFMNKEESNEYLVGSGQIRAYPVAFL